MNTLNDPIQIFKEVGKGRRTDKTISELCLIGLFVDCDEFGSNDSKYISFSDDVGNPLKFVHPAFLSLLFTDVVKDKLKIFTRCPKIYLILSAIILVIQYFWNFLINENVPIDYVEHTL